LYSELADIPPHQYAVFSSSGNADESLAPKALRSYVSTDECIPLGYGALW
jgi:hypothetical protein